MPGAKQQFCNRLSTPLANPARLLPIPCGKKARCSSADRYRASLEGLAAEARSCREASSGSQRRLEVFGVFPQVMDRPQRGFLFH